MPEVGQVWKDKIGKTEEDKGFYLINTIHENGWVNGQQLRADTRAPVVGASFAVHKDTMMLIMEKV